MSDTWLRALGRRFLGTRSPDDEAAVLGGLARLGGEAATRIELAAALDHPPAVSALGGADAPEGWPALRRLLVAPTGASAAADGLRPRLTLATSGGEHLTVTAPCEPVAIGRDPSCALRLGLIMA